MSFSDIETDTDICVHSSRFYRKMLNLYTVAHTTSRNLTVKLRTMFVFHRRDTYGQLCFNLFSQSKFETALIRTHEWHPTQAPLTKASAPSLATLSPSFQMRRTRLPSVTPSTVRTKAPSSDRVDPFTSVLGGTDETLLVGPFVILFKG